jgi:thiamine transport system ATP-binding protein
MLALEQLAARYGEVVALHELDLAVGDGDRVSVLGPSGSGKSTMLRAIAGLAEGSTGRVSWNGLDLTDVPPHRREFGLMFQEHALFPHRDVAGNVEFGLRMQRVPRASATARTRELLDLVGLSGFERRAVSELSGGEQQRVALARALAPAPRLLMLDEPLGALDRKLREELVVELRALVERLGLTSLFVTHDQDEAFAFADRVVVMRAGRVEQEGPALDVWRRPANRFVADFLGWNVSAALDPDRRGVVAVRPEALRLDRNGPVRGIVRHGAFRRDHWLVTVELSSGDPVRVVVPSAEPLPGLGTPVGLRSEPGAAVPIADGETTRAD